MPARLLQIDEAADMLGVPVASLRAAADEHGKTIRMGRAVRLHPDDLEELIQLCRVQRKERASGAGETPASGSSSTAKTSAARARQTAEKLRKRSRNTSSAEPARVVPLSRKG